MEIIRDQSSVGTFVTEEDSSEILTESLNTFRNFEENDSLWNGDSREVSCSNTSIDESHRFSSSITTSQEEDSSKSSYSATNSSHVCLPTSDHFHDVQLATSQTSSNYLKDSVTHKSHFLTRSVEHLRAQNSSQKKSSQLVDSNDLHLQKEEADFCQRYVSKIQLGTPNNLKSSKQSRVTNATTSSVPVINPAVVDRLKFERLVHAMKEVTTQNETDGEWKSCHICRKLKFEAELKMFTQERVRYMENKLTEERLHNHLLKMDSLSQIGSLAANLPKPSDPAEEIWEKLLKKKGVISI